MSDFLATMVAESETRAAVARRSVPEAHLRQRALDGPDPTPPRWHPRGFDVIAEIKRRAPSAGALESDGARATGFVASQADAYARGGAAALSVLTEPTRFDGCLDDVREAAAAVRLPVMRKDFLTDPYQVMEARAAGAAGVLLIVRMLSDTRLTEMLDVAAEMDLFVLLEAFDADDLQRTPSAVRHAARREVSLLVGVNARDLSTLTVDEDRLTILAARCPAGVPLVAESGIDRPADAAAAAAAGYQIALIGTALMRAADPAALTASLIDAGRAAARNPCESA